MKILMISSFLPFPLYSGGHIRLYNLLKNLSGDFKVTLICEKRKNQTKEDIKEVEKVCQKVLTVERKFQWSYKNIFKTGFSKDSFLVTGHTLPEMKEMIKEELGKERYDLIHVETFYVMQNLPKVLIPVVLVEHNVEYLVYKRYMDKVSILLRPLLLIDILKLKKQEIAFWRKAKKLVAVSREEKTLMRREDVALVPNGVDLEKYNIAKAKYQKQEVKTILFIGDFKWIQNVNASEIILREIWPRVYEENKSLKLWIVGKRIPDSIKSMRAQNVSFDENAPKETEEIYREADILLAPKYIGGGTSYKILEAMASGVAVVTTSLGAEGIVSPDSKEISIADSSEELANAVLKLTKDSDLRVEQVKKARELIEDRYDWKKIAKQLEDVYTQALT